MRGKVIYEEGNPYRIDTGAAYVRLTEYTDPNGHSLYVLESQLNGEPGERWSSDVMDTVSVRELIEDNKEILSPDNPYCPRSAAIRAAIARYDELTSRAAEMKGAA